MLNPIEHARNAVAVWQYGVAWVEMDGQLQVSGVNPLEQGLVQHREAVRMGIPAQTESSELSV